MKAKIVLLIMMLLTSMTVVISADGGYEPLAGPNYMGFTESIKHVTVGDTFYSYIYGDIHSEIDTIAVDNLTYLPAGVINYVTSSTPNYGGEPPYSNPNAPFWDDAINDHVVGENKVWDIVANIKPSSGHNIEGYVKAWNQALANLSVGNASVNNINSTMARITWSPVSCGIVTLTITAGGTARGGIDPGTTMYSGTVTVHPQTPSGIITTPHTYSIDLSWAKGTGATRTVIRGSTSGYPATPTSGTDVYNGTGTSTTHSGLNPSELWYYRSWSFSSSIFSLTYDQDTETTLAGVGPNSPPTFGTPSPTNGSTGRPLSLTWGIPINDPDGDLMNFRISCSNGQFTDVAGASNGTKSLSISGLAFNTVYKVWVNATDPAGTGNWTRRWYQFTTSANQPPSTPGVGDITPSNSAPDVPVYIGFLRVVVTDPESQTMDVSFYWGNTTLIGTDTAVASGSTASIAIPNLAYNTTYYWNVSIDDKYGGVTEGPAIGNWSYTTEAYVPIPPGGPTVHIHNFYVTVIDDVTNLPIANALCKVMKGNEVQGQGLTGIYGTWSGQFEDSGRYTLVVTANGYITSTTSFTVSQKDVFMTVRMITGITPAGLTNAQGGLTTLGFIFLAILILTIISAFYIWYNYYGGKKRKRR